MITPPILTRRVDVVDEYHGVEVPDPYRWLEDGNDPNVREWVAEQNRLARDALDPQSSRPAWHASLVAFMELAVVQAVQVRGDRLVVLERDRCAQQARLVVRPLADPSSECTMIADPAADAGDGAIAIDWYETSADGALVAYGVSEGGTENSVLRVARTADGSDVGVTIANCRAASVAFDIDGTGFHYTRYPDGDEYHRTVHHHSFGDDPADDPVVWAEHPNPQAWPGVEMSPDGRHLLVWVMVGWSRYDIHLLATATREWTTVVEEVEAVNSFTFDGDRLIGSTTLDAPRGRVVAVPLGRAGDGPSAWETLVPEREAVIRVPRLTSGGFLIAASTGGVDSIERYASDGTLLGTIDDVGLSAVVQVATDGAETSTAVALLTGFESPPTLYTIDGDAVVPLHPARDYGPTLDLTVSHLEYESTDGTPIGVFLVHRSDVVPDSDTPTILNGYGGFAITESPMFSPTIAAWCEAGGLYAIAQLRGGGEHGEAWHEAGKRANKQNVFDDFHAAADWLVSTGRTSRERLAIAGGSNGGLLVGAALTQRPDLCRAVWCAVPLLDMVRFPNFLIARLWTDEYGDPDVAEEFPWVWSYSPYHRARVGERYPAVLFTTAEGDTRVDPMHARKMAAMLQYASADQDARPVLFHQEGRAGHGVGKPVGKRADEQADVLAFFSWQLGHDNSELP